VGEARFGQVEHTSLIALERAAAAGAAAFILKTLFFLRDLTMMVAPIVALEIFFPKRSSPSPSLLSRVRAVAIWLSAAPIAVIVGDLVASSRAALHAKPLLDAAALPLPPIAKVAIAWLLGWFVGDFVYYWYHRAAHKWFWRIHGVHHSIRELNVLTSYDHPIEWLMIVFLYSLPVAFLVTDPYAPILMGTTFGYYLHANTRVHLGPLGYIIQDNRYHRVHHSLEREHWDKNFCVFVTVWDVLFRTACFDGMKRWPEVGVQGLGEVDSIREFWLRPFRRPEPMTPAPVNPPRPVVAH
jgi:sterol desaturase/sphingolipid hydroxylase (fatty acid hydroxylase superfamily)